ncbi:MAG: nicotinate-nucleotide adenylyltransferase [Alphaproteobacteria bacterium]|nr:nicotinate-nucleotide adenylyltransferase [Alphaproteobacteria bacterium]
MVTFFDGAKVALFGGSFDPPHQGHVTVAKAALRALKVDYVWWLVAPQNPLKPHQPQAMTERLAAVRQLADDKRFIISDEETKLGTHYAIDTVHALKAALPHVDFIWLIGADNLADLHRWKDWQGLMRTIPLAVYPRPGAAHKAALSPAARAFDWARLGSENAAQLALYQAPAWVMLNGKRSTLASSRLRKNGD